MAFTCMPACLRKRIPAAHLHAQEFVLDAVGQLPSFNFLHLRIEKDWMEHCAVWSSITDGQVRDNCLNNSNNIHDIIQSFGFNKNTSMMLETYWEDVDTETNYFSAVKHLSGVGYKICTLGEVLSPLLRSRFTALERDLRAAVIYFVAMNAERFIGNSVSTFAALLIMERRSAGKWAAYYNGGNIPLSQFIPGMLRLPWVFAHTDHGSHSTSTAGYDYMVKAAVRSAIIVDSLDMYCIFLGTADSEIAQWLTKHNVTMIYHIPAWKNEFERIYHSSQAAKNAGFSHLYANLEMMFGTYLRVDIPIMPEFEQFTYVFYSDTDALFLRSLTLEEFPLPLPRTISMAYEVPSDFPYNAGVMLVNVPALRKQHKVWSKNQIVCRLPRNKSHIEKVSWKCSNHPVYG
eukprot:366336-Chlamydomonas_euryale.AAC.14